MAAGDTFTQLLSDDTPPPAQPGIEPLSDEPGVLEQAASAAKLQKGKDTLAGPTGGPDPTSSQTLKDAAEAAFWKREDVALAGRRAREAAGINADRASLKEEAQRGDMISKYGTDDPLKAAKIEALGVFSPDASKQMQIDPEGFRQRVDYAKTILGRSQANTAGERGLQGGGAAYGTPSGGTLSQVARTPSRAEQIAYTLFEGRLRGAEDLATTPTKEEDKKAALQEKHEHIVKQADYVTKLLTSARQGGDQVSALEQLTKDRRDPDLADIDPRTFDHAEALLGKYGKPQQELMGNFSKYGPDYFPIRRGNAKPGAMEDKLSPASVLNPGGAPDPMEAARARIAEVMAQPMPHTADEVQDELPSASDYARGEQTVPGAKRSNLGIGDFVSNLFFGKPPQGPGEAETQ